LTLHAFAACAPGRRYIAEDRAQSKRSYDRYDTGKEGSPRKAMPKAGGKGVDDEEEEDEGTYCTTAD
jgi:hypothetical protein